MHVAGDAANPNPTFSGDAEQKTLKITYTTNDGSDRYHYNGHCYHQNSTYRKVLKYWDT